MAQLSTGGAALGPTSMLASGGSETGRAPARRVGNRSVSSVARFMNGDRGRELQFRHSFHRCQFPMLLVDNRRRYVDANRAARLLFRLSLGELTRRRIDDLTPRDGLARLEVLWSELFRKSEVCGDYHVYFEDDSQLDVVFSALANILPGQHLLVFAPAAWPDDELGILSDRVSSRAPSPLSAREHEVLTLIADGLTLLEVADRLTISPATVRTHAANIYRKLGARNRPHAVALGLGLGLITPPRQAGGQPVGD
jgi:DNA-binding CsgD family transcriptional regulator